jgi:hypothetical protein
MVPLTGTTVQCSTSQRSAIDVQLTPVPLARRNPRSATACSANFPWIHSRPAANHLPGMAFERSLRVAAIHPSRCTVRGYGLATTARWLKRFGPSGPRDTLQPTTTYFNAHRGQAPRDRVGAILPTLTPDPAPWEAGRGTIPHAEIVDSLAQRETTEAGRPQRQATLVMADIAARP